MTDAKTILTDAPGCTQAEVLAVTDTATEEGCA